MRRYGNVGGCGRYVRFIWVQLNSRVDYLRDNSQSSMDIGSDWNMVGQKIAACPCGRRQAVVEINCLYLLSNQQHTALLTRRAGNRK